MNSDLFNDFCRQGTEGKLELIDGKLIVGNSIVGSRLLLRQILQGWGAEAAVAIAPVSLWIEALAVNLELNPGELNHEDPPRKKVIRDANDIDTTAPSSTETAVREE